MGRKFRRLSFRIGGGAFVAAACVFVHHRWTLRKGSATLTAPRDAALSSLPPAERRAQHLSALAAARPPSWPPAPFDAHAPPVSSAAAAGQDNVFDVLVVGGGLTGLYAAVDAAQRGLRVALVEAADFGSGATATQPPVCPGAFPYVQRAIRQRDARWLRRACDALVDATVWQNTAPHCTRLADTTAATPPNGVRTLIPALHTAELVELCASACLSTVLSLWCGPLRYCTPWRSAAAVQRELPALQVEGNNGSDTDGATCGGVVAWDFCLDGAAAATSLACTAEALGVTLVNYASLCGLRYEDGRAFYAERKSAPAAYRDAGAPAAPHSAAGEMERDVLVVATIRNEAPLASEQGDKPSASSHCLQLRTRSVVNCAGAWADDVKALVPDNSADAVTAAFGQFCAYSYLVAPRTALFPLARSCERQDATPAVRRQGFQWLADPSTALQMASTKFSFASVFVLPWYADTVLLGPSITPLQGLPGVVAQDRSGLATPEALLSFPDGFRVQQSRITQSLASCGVGVDRAQVLACLSTVVPVTRNPRQLPWADELLLRGYHISRFEPICGGAEVAEGTEAAPASRSAPSPSPASVPPFVHVYGGSALSSRRVAADAIDRLLHETAASRMCAGGDGTAQRSLRSRTRWLRLTDARGAAHDSTGSSAVEGSVSGASEDSAAKLEALARDTFTTRLTDFLARRTHVAYTSPADALRAVPTLAAYLAAVNHWSPARTEEEVGAAETLIRGVAIQHPDASWPVK